MKWIKKHGLQLFFAVLLLASIACSAVSVNFSANRIVEIGQDEPVNISCSNNTWTASPKNGVQVSFTDHDGFLYQLRRDQLTARIYRNDKEIDRKTLTVTDGLIEVSGILPDMPYKKGTVDVRFTIYFLICGGKLYWTDFTIPPLPSQQG